MEYVENYRVEMTEDLYNETKKQIEKADLTGEKRKAKKEGANTARKKVVKK